MFTFLNDMYNYEGRVVANNKLDNGLIVDTAFSSDEGYETAICDASDSWHPVERYETKELSEFGHKKWVEFANTTPKQINKLGWGSLVDDEIIELEYKHTRKE